MLVLPKVVKDLSPGEVVKKIGKIVMTVLATATIASTAMAGTASVVTQDTVVSSPMLMMPTASDGKMLPWHSSHSSHASHASHASHMSHMSHYSGRY